MSVIPNLTLLDFFPDLALLEALLKVDSAALKTVLTSTFPLSFFFLCFALLRLTALYPEARPIAHQASGTVVIWGQAFFFSLQTPGPCGVKTPFESLCRCLMLAQSVRTQVATLHKGPDLLLCTEVRKSFLRLFSHIGHLDCDPVLNFW